jgi:hypothetical protein
MRLKGDLQAVTCHGEARSRGRGSRDPDLEVAGFGDGRLGERRRLGESDPTAVSVKGRQREIPGVEISRSAMHERRIASVSNRKLVEARAAEPATHGEVGQQLAKRPQEWVGMR